MVSLAVAGAVFILGFTSRKFSDSSFILNISILFLFVSVLDFMHTITYYQLGIFPGLSPNIATQYWIAARIIQSLFFFVIIAFSENLKEYRLTTSLMLLVTSVFIILINLGLFPVCYIENQGLRNFKSGWNTKEFLMSYHEYSLEKDIFVNKNKIISPLYHKIFNKMPIPLLKAAGSILYKHIG